MPTELKEHLKELLDDTLGLIGDVGVGGLIIFTLNNQLGFELSVLSNPEKLVTTFFANILPILLMGATFFWYITYRRNVSHELSLIGSVFVEGNISKDITSLKGHSYIAIIRYVLALVFLSLFLLPPWIFWFCVAALVLHFADLIGSSIVLQNLNKNLSTFKVPAKDINAGFISERRKVLVEYYYDNPTLMRICIIIIITTIALVLSAKFPATNPGDNWYSVPYAMMIANIVIGEVVIKLWRAKRDHELREISSDQQKARKKRKR